MARAAGGDGGGKVRVEVEILDLDKGEDQPQLVAYGFGGSGALLARSELKGGTGELAVPATPEPEALRVLVGPAIDSDDQGELLATLARVGAEEHMVRLSDERKALRVPIDRIVWGCWQTRCVARGKLLKKVTSGGVAIDLPVCDAEIEVYEVDPVGVIVARIPDHILEKLRTILRRPLPWPPPEDFQGGLVFPPRPPGPEPMPGPVEVDPLSLRAELAFLAEEPQGPGVQHDEAGEEAGATLRSFRFDSGEPTVASPTEVAASLQALSAEPAVRSAAAAGLAPLRSALLAHADLLRPILCFIWPAAVTTQLVATTTTDHCGRFRTSFWPGCTGDVPDLYFKAFRRIGSFRFPIYAPTPIACHTWWNYACGTEVVLRTTSPFAVTCAPCPPVIAPKHWVLAMAVGNTSLARIRGTGTGLPAAPLGLTDVNAPFGGYIRLRLEFDYLLRTDLNVRYYRLRWRKAGSGNPFLDLTDDVRRHYGQWIGSTFVIQPYSLGVQTVGTTPNLYEIPPPLPQVGQWVIADAVEDTTSAAFPSVAFAPPAGAGLYELELTLFDGGGTAVNANSLGISFRVPQTTDLTTTIPTADAASLGLVTAAGRFVMTLHIDNNLCSGSIAAPMVGGMVASDECGVLDYASMADTVTLAWSSTHPNGFANYSFNVYRGVNLALSRPVGVLPPLGPASEAPTVGSLLGPCTIAGFAETLYVDATATDGWRTLDEYDFSAVRAFVLKP